ncbi:unnamed protein product [Parascedosporium putredinis]|uniref:Mitochondrial ATP synthase epsilon chain domain-containing protein n=1 Tax=Parascedosporium putredinis TaxID=1442378 RepID=A0A9P1H771_9PEZI|nr:unnamed protein product [Parascedosporium putredinis]CAI7999572.1 unnamed protein product [Parascedosporium putredinis]
MTFAWKAAGISYNRYLAVAARAVRRSLKDDKRIAVERRGEVELKLASWKNGKQSDAIDLNQANAAARAEAAAKSS